MESKEFFNKLMSRYLWGHIAAMIAVVVVVCAGVKFGIDLYTHHGEAISVPDIRHKKYADAEHLLSERGLQIVVSDTGYVKTLPPDCILEQSPTPGEKVKSGHIIYVTVNSSHSPTLVVPDVIDNSSYREAKAKLIAMGFKIGEPKFVAGEKDWVYGIMANGLSVNAGDRVPVDARLTILVGDGQIGDPDDVDIIDPEMEDAGDDFEETKEGDISTQEDKDEFEVVTSPE